MAQSVREEVGLGVRVVGAHPAAFAHQFERWVSAEGEAGKERAVENYRHSIEAALAFVHEGQAHAIGEVGRPHWPVSDEVWNLSNELLDETMHLAAQEGLPLQLHVEGESDDTYSDLAARALRQGMDLRKLVRILLQMRSSNTHGLTGVPCGRGVGTLAQTHGEAKMVFFLRRITRMTHAVQAVSTQNGSSAHSNSWMQG